MTQGLKKITNYNPQPPQPADTCSQMHITPSTFDLKDK